MTTFLTVPSLLWALFWVPLAAYVGLLAALARRLPVPSPRVPPRRRFALVVPAHDEEGQIQATVDSLLAIDYPASLRRVVVVADNCTDATAARARAAGAEVLERTDPARRGKGYALDFAFRRLVSAGDLDAVAVVDADSVVSPNLLQAFAARLDRGESVMQAEYGVRNPHASWRTRLIAVAFAMFHRTRSLTRERLGLSVGLRGNGMCFAVPVLERHPHRIYGLVEDVEYGIVLGLAGHRVAYAHEAWVRGEMVASSASAVSQRRRWEAGRLALMRRYLPHLVVEAVRRRRLMLWDLALDVAVPPLSYHGLAIALGFGLEGVAWALTGIASWTVWLWSTAAFCLLLYVWRGVQGSGLGARGLLVLAYAPAYVAWKIILARPFRHDDRWIRTGRESARENGCQGRYM